MALQRFIGNRATVALLQRDVEDEDLEAAAGMFKQAEHGPGAARGWGALRGLVDESRPSTSQGTERPPGMERQVRGRSRPRERRSFAS